MNNLELWQKFGETPNEAKKEIAAGRLKGFTDINPMWRLKMLTEHFGICGVGWKTQTVKKWLELGANGTVAAFVDIMLYININGEWSSGIEGNGGSMFISQERNGLYTSDEAFKMAETDAIGSACKKLGMSADVYFAKDRTKYSTAKEEIKTEKQTPKKKIVLSNNGEIDEMQLEVFMQWIKKDPIKNRERISLIYEISETDLAIIDNRLKNG